jgi:hypothetical protein
LVFWIEDKKCIFIATNYTTNEDKMSESVAQEIAEAVIKIGEKEINDIMRYLSGKAFAEVADLIAGVHKFFAKHNPKVIKPEEAAQ